MNPVLKALLEKLEALVAESKTLLEKSERSEDDKKRIQALPDEIKACEKEIAKEKSLEDASREARLRIASASASPLNPVADEKSREVVKDASPKSKSVNVHTKSWGVPKNLVAAGIAVEEARDTAYAIGKELSEIKAAGFRSDPGEDGGNLVGPEFERALVVLREKYGIARQFMEVVPMMSDTKLSPRNTSNLTMTAVGEGVTTSKQREGTDLVELVARKAMVLTDWPSELDEDSWISVGDRFVNGAAFAAAKFEDQCAFIGDGTSKYNRIVGLSQRLIDSFTTSGGAGLVLGSGNAWNELTLEDHEKVVGSIPEYADEGAGWYTSRKYFWTVMVKLMLASGGVTAAEVTSGRVNTFMGYPVRIVQVMPRAEANSQVPVIFGNLAMSSKLGDRRGLRVGFSDQTKFEEDLIVGKATTRFDIINHTIKSLEDPINHAGPVVGLITAAS